ncbi:MAG: ABC transporter substrate-binding protein, partial [Lacrimispora sphenoides]
MKKSMKKLLSLVMAVALAASLTACGSGKTSETTAGEKAASGESSEAAKASGEGSFKIGGIGPITGSTAIYGQAVMRGAELAIDEINANGGINGTQIEYSFQDDENDTEKAVNAYNTLKDWGMQMLV